MVKMISFQVEDAFAKAIDDLVLRGFYSSRSEFLKDSIRQGLEKQLMVLDSFQKVHSASEELRKEFKSKNTKIKNLSKSERIKIADELLEKNLA
ncbi:MAG: ribbon-helix-helix domain-containing protein [archaeon]|jgi:Arc/MetJ-type ribon-helix-helix transcriptional regulator